MKPRGRKYAMGQFHMFYNTLVPKAVMRINQKHQ